MSRELNESILVQIIENSQFSVVDILSISKNNTILIGPRWSFGLYVCNTYGTVLNFIHFEYLNLLDAIWTSQGDILYTSKQTTQITLISSKGVSITYFKLRRPNYFGTSSKDKIIYVTDSEWGSLYQSTDDGINWNFVVQLPFGWNYGQLVKLETNSNITTFWSIAFRAPSTYKLREFSFLKSFNNDLTWRDIELPTFTNISLSNSRLAYDNANTMFISDTQQKTVYTLTVNSEYRGQLLTVSKSDQYLKLAMGADRCYLYVASNQLIYVYQLKYNTDFIQ